MFPDQFDKDKVQRIIKNLFGNKPAYRYSLSDPQYSKSQLEEMILKYKTLLNNPNAEFNKEENFSNKQEYDSAHEEIKQSILELENKHSKAPEKVEYELLTINDEKLADGISAFVYDFFGYSVDKYSKPEEGGNALDENNEYLNKIQGFSFLSFNAIDGSIIDRNLGY